MTFAKLRAATTPPHGFLRVVVSLAFLSVLAGFQARAQVTITDINPDQSTLDPMDPDGASGGRVNGLSAVVGDPDTYYAASEWGGLYKTTDFTNAGPARIECPTRSRVSFAEAGAGHQMPGRQYPGCSH